MILTGTLAIVCSDTERLCLSWRVFSIGASLVAIDCRRAGMREGLVTKGDTMRANGGWEMLDTKFAASEEIEPRCPSVKDNKGMMVRAFLSYDVDFGGRR